MKIEVNKFYLNKTLQYLYPILGSYGITFKTRIRDISKMAVGISDALLDNEKLNKVRSIYILMDSFYKPNVFTDFIRWIRYQPFYITDYSYNGVHESRQHMLVIEFPESYWDSYDKFLIGEYKSMYDKETVEKYFSSLLIGTDLIYVLWKEAEEVLLNTESAKIRFQQRLKGFYGSDIDVEVRDLDNCNLDLPINLFLEDEVFNLKLSEIWRTVQKDIIQEN
jgi:hypothetical protein